jgi:hypothetical protein
MTTVPGMMTEEELRQRGFPGGDVQLRADYERLHGHAPNFVVSEPRWLRQLIFCAVVEARPSASAPAPADDPEPGMRIASNAEARAAMTAAEFRRYSGGLSRRVFDATKGTSEQRNRRQHVEAWQAWARRNPALAARRPRAAVEPGDTDPVP